MAMLPPWEPGAARRSFGREWGRRMSDVEDAVARRSGDARLDRLIRFAAVGAVTKVSDNALDQRHDAGVADAHPAAVRHLDPGVLPRLHERRGTVDVDLDVGLGEPDVPALTAVTADLRTREALDMQALLEPGVGPELLGRVQQRFGATGPGLPVPPVGADVRHGVDLEPAVGLRELLVQPDALVLVGEL